MENRGVLGAAAGMARAIIWRFSGETGAMASADDPRASQLDRALGHL